MFVLSIWLHGPIVEWRALFECNGIMHQIQINVSQTEFFATVTACLFNFFRLMVGVPKFRYNENFLTFDDTFFDFLLNGFADFALIFIQASRVKMTIASVNRMFCSFTGFSAQWLWLKNEKKKKRNAKWWALRSRSMWQKQHSNGISNEVEKQN